MAKNKIIPPTPSRAEYLDNGPRQMGWLQADEPISLFEKWLLKAGETEPNDPNAMSLATVGADGRQIRIRGAVRPVPAADSDTYFAQRARGSRIGAWASDQSCAVASREAMVDCVEAVEAKYADQDVPRPPHWHGWCVSPREIEFWQDGAFRLHDRILFTKSEAGDWTKARLFP